MFNKFKTGDRVNIIIHNVGMIEGNIMIISDNKKAIILENIEYSSNCYSCESWIKEPVIHIAEEEVYEINLIA